MLLASTDLAGPRRRAACEHRRPHTRRIPRGQQKIYGEFTCTYTPNGELLTKTDSTTGEVIQQWLWSGQLRIAAELDGSGNLVAQHIYGDKANVPELILRGGKTYRVITDHLGSPVMVVNIEDATDVLFEARYDAWGNRTVLVGDEDAVPFGQGHCGLKSPIWAPPTRRSCGQDGFRRRRRSPRPTSPSSASHALELRVERTSLQLQPDSAGLTAESAAPPPWVAKVPPSATTEAPPVP